VVSVPFSPNAIVISSMLAAIYGFTSIYIRKKAIVIYNVICS
jgi:hypothetical protein